MHCLCMLSVRFSEGSLPDLFCTWGVLAGNRSLEQAGIASLCSINEAKVHCEIGLLSDVQSTLVFDRLCSEG